MKKTWRIVSLVLVLAILLTISVVAAERTATENATVTAITTAGGYEATAYFKENSDEAITVTVTGDAIKAGKEHLILMVKGSQRDYEIKRESILFIDQKAAAGNEEAGTITFDVIPSELCDSVILVVNESNTVIAAILDGRFVLGDLTGDDIVDVGDAMLLLQYVASKVQLTETQMQAADVDQDGNVTSNDATLLLRIVAGIASFN